MAASSRFTDLHLAHRTAVIGRLLPALLIAVAPPGRSQPPSGPNGFTSAPPNPPPLQRDPGGDRALSLAAPPGLYSIGEPTDDEQLYVELINRARADPAAEGRRLVATMDPDIIAAYEFFGVDLNSVVEQFDAISAAPPLSIHPQLTAAARRHSMDMFENQFQGHDGSDGSDAEQRVTEAGYDWSAISENVFAYSLSAWYGHVAFNVDWGNGPGGIQEPPGHRRAIHNSIFREIGVGVVNGENGEIGPQVVTQEFASRSNLSPFVTGVVYYDLNGNQFYDLGEGIGGVTVRVAGTTAYAVTSRSGGYSVPVSGGGTRTVTFSVPGLADVSRPAVIPANANVKIDHSPSYTPPVIGGSSVAYVGRDNMFVFSPVGAATSYQWRVTRRIAWTTPEGAETGLGRLTAATSPGYAPATSDVRHNGNAAFHLAHPEPAGPQILELTHAIRLGTQSELTFWSRLGIASENQVARVELSADGGVSWQELWQQAGNGQPGEQSFTQQRVSLSAHAGRSVALRFVYDFQGGTYFPQTDRGIGWYLDDILVSSAEELIPEGDLNSVSSGTSFVFRPSAAGDYLLEVRPLVGDRPFPWGPALPLTATDNAPPELRILGLSREADGGWAIPFRSDGVSGTPQIESAQSVTGPWAPVTGVEVEPGAMPGEFTARVPARAAAVPSEYFRVRSQQ